VFFGALLSAIMSCSSATLLAPSVAFSENIIRGALPGMSDRAFLWTMRVTLWCFAGIVLTFALHTEATIFKMVENAYKVTLVSAFFPLFLGLYWKRANTQGALCGIAAGLSMWLALEFFGGSMNEVWPPQLVGFLAAGTAMVIGSLAPPLAGRTTPPHPEAPAARRHDVGRTPS
jgi:Na+/proline symporter